MNGKGDAPGLDTHLLPIEGELNCSPHSPLHNSEQPQQFRAGAACEYFPSSSLHLPFPWCDCRAVSQSIQ